MKIYKHRLFQQWAKTEHLTDKALRQAIDELTQGLYEASLGSGFYKKRIAMPGKGKRGSYRTLIAFKSEQNAFFLYGFAKNVSDNISSSEKIVYRKLAKDLLNLLPDELQHLLDKGKLFEVK